MGSSSSKSYNTTVYNYGGTVCVSYRALGERHPQIARLRIDNDTQESVTVELKTPGGTFLIATQTTGADEMDDLDALKATYDLVVAHGGRTETVRNVRLTEDNTLTISEILAGDVAGLPRDEGAPTVTEATRLDEFFSGDVLKTVVDAAEVAPSERLGEALAKYTALAQRQAQQAQAEAQTQAQQPVAAAA
ncbi:hypothetical protein DENSPDRAFT_853057 [Dentipellis sp. KUC8613]|nr:hypothetical protein DENSPDRAFT_853057 [Dentipellis sp. KUC8613]